MTEDEVAPARAVWRLGDYYRFAREQMWEIGPVVVNACGISQGQRVLDVAAGSGNVAIRAAQASAEVVASDITPENLEAGRKEADTLGAALEWVEADAQALPFGDDEFDVVTSSFGAIFAPDHQKVADELLRVCRPGGTICLTTFPPGGLAEDIFGVVAPYMPPPPPDANSPLLWGTEEHVRRSGGEQGSEAPRLVDDLGAAGRRAIRRCWRERLVHGALDEPRPHELFERQRQGARRDRKL
jgi:SAM-dependent methyltransferase